MKNGLNGDALTSRLISTAQLTNGRIAGSLRNAENYVPIAVG
jgi:hypothetical protein